MSSTRDLLDPLRRAEVAELRLESVRSLHGDPDFNFKCTECRKPWPCPTYQAVDG